MMKMTVDQKILHMIEKWKMPKRHVLLEREMLSGIREEVFKQIDDYIFDFPNNGQGLFLHSNQYGSGKTSLAVFVVKEIFLMGKINGMSVKFFETSHLINEIIRTYKDGTHRDDFKFIDKCMSSTILVLDDLGKEKPSAHTAQKLFMILNARYNDLLPFIITSNYNIHELAERFKGDGNEAMQSLISRIEDTCVQVAL